MAPDTLERVAFPQPLGERWPVVGGLRLGADEPDRAGAIPLADAVHRRIGRHAPADDQVRVVGHTRRCLPPVSAGLVAVAGYALLVMIRRSGIRSRRIRRPRRAGG